MSEKKYKVVVAHPGKQHSFQLATAMKKAGMLNAYITTVYKKQNSLQLKLLKKLLSDENAKRMETRRNENLEDNEVVQFCSSLSLITLLLVRIEKIRPFYIKWNTFVSDLFGKRVAKYAIKNHVDMVICYDSNSRSCFEYLKNNAPSISRVMDVSHSYRIYEKKLFERDMELIPDWAAELKKERKYLWKASLDRYREEIMLTDYFLVPSSYVKRTLQYAGVDESKIFINPYGVNLNQFTYKERISDRNNEELPFFIFVGSIWQTKGIGHLLEAFREVQSRYPDAKIHLVGGKLSDEVNEKYGNCAVSHGYVQHEQMAELYQKADVMVFPSLSEGMTLSGLEALGCGIPVLCTENSGVNDLIADGVNGFVVPPCDSHAIAEKITWFIEHKDKIPQMKKNAALSIGDYSWECYYQRTSKVITGILDGRNTDKEY